MRQFYMDRANITHHTFCHSERSEESRLAVVPACFWRGPSPCRHSGESRNPGFNWNRLRRYLERQRCGSRAACGLLSCRDKKVTKDAPSRSLHPGAAQLVQIAQRQFELRQCSRTPPAESPVLGSLRRGNVKTNINTHVRRNSLRSLRPSR